MINSVIKRLTALTIAMVLTVGAASAMADVRVNPGDGPSSGSKAGGRSEQVRDRTGTNPNGDPDQPQSNRPNASGGYSVNPVGSGPELGQTPGKYSFGAVWQMYMNRLLQLIGVRL